ncbi:thioredoxin [Candidatus Peribacteria bacterium]|nr:thioredoxin [Candidatus Peribacteria bacterium]
MPYGRMKHSIFSPHTRMKHYFLAFATVPLLLLGGCLPTVPPSSDTNTSSSAAMEKEEMMEEGTAEDRERDEAMMKKDDMMEKNEDAMMKKEGTVISDGMYKDATASNLPASVLTDGTTKVLYFFAAWCPTCKKGNQTLTSWYAGGGKGMVTVYKLNYDEEKALKQKYGVPYQHTFVKVDGKGNMIEKKEGPSDEVLKALLQS